MVIASAMYCDTAHGSQLYTTQDYTYGRGEGFKGDGGGGGGGGSRVVYSTHSVEFLNFENSKLASFFLGLLSQLDMAP